MRMTPVMLILGGLIVYWASITLMVILPVFMIHPHPSDIWRPLTKAETEGNRLYVTNGCSYCHSQYIRVLDWGHGAYRIAQAGDYNGRRPAILGSERTGPDLSQEGGEHPDDWHIAHFVNPRNTSPVSVMPSWEFLGPEKLRLLTALMQAEGGKLADFRVQRQNAWKKLAVAAYHAGSDSNIAWIHSQVPTVWLEMPNPYPAESQDLLRGKKIYQEFCMNCHGVMGDGQGPAARYLMPPPLNFTTLRRNLISGKYIGGLFYYQIMNGITGTAMPYFKRALESEKIWDLSNYVAVSFVGYTDANIAPRGIDAAYESPWKNPYLAPPAPTPIPTPGGKP